MVKITLKVLVFLCFLSTTTAFAQKKIFESPKMKGVIPIHKTVAILPFQVTIKMKKLPKNTTVEDIARQEKLEATNIQNSVYTFLLRKSKKYTVTFQDVAKTNALLAKAGITQENMATKTMDEIAKALEVDAVIGGSVVTDRPISEGGAVALAVLAGVWFAPSNEAKTVMTIHNGADAELLWRYERTVSGGVGSSTDDLVERMMRQIARNFPYEN
ncbi:hypothetical protein AD998_12660 [bacterium 336/3]|nr:hypothetical protein AD998_12660 [bacterium 336/3]